MEANKLLNKAKGNLSLARMAAKQYQVQERNNPIKMEKMRIKETISKWLESHNMKGLFSIQEAARISSPNLGGSRLLNNR